MSDLQEDRVLYKMIADPIQAYLKRQGLDPVKNLALISGLASEVYDNLKPHIKVNTNNAGGPNR